MARFTPINEPQPASEKDLARRTVRILSRRPNGLVEFEFSIGWPELGVELMLPEQDFQDFCNTQMVKPMTTGRQAQ